MTDTDTTSDRHTAEAECQLSVVIPLYNSAGTVEELCRKLTIELPRIVSHFEIVLVDDGSRDNTVALARSIAVDNPKVRLIRLIRNFGQHSAITAGLSQAKGEWIVLMDDDLQNPPEEIERLYQTAMTGWDIVFGARVKRQDSWFRRLGSQLSQRLLTTVLHVNIPDAISSFQILSRRVVDEYLELTEQRGYVAPLLCWLGFKYTSIPVRHDARKSGRSGYSWTRLAKLWFGIVFGFSEAPLRFATWVGIAFSTVAFALLGRAVFHYATSTRTIEGYTSLFAAQMLFSGVTLIFMGIIGEYVGRIYREVKGRPLFLIDKEGSTPPIPREKTR